MGLMKLETTDNQDIGLDKIKELTNTKARTKGMKKFLDLIADGKIAILIK